MITLYGIKNCDTVRKACRWLDANGVEYHFHDVRKDGLTAARIKSWADEVTWEKLLNRRGLTWRKLSDDDRADINARKAIKLMAAEPTLVKRPVIETGLAADRAVLVGFDEARYRAELL